MWFYSITGAHKGGGLDSTLIIQKTESGLDDAAEKEAAAPAAAAAAVAAAAGAAAGSAANTGARGAAAATELYALSPTGLPAKPAHELLAFVIAIGALVFYRNRIVARLRRLVGRHGAGPTFVPLMEVRGDD